MDFEEDESQSYIFLIGISDFGIEYFADLTEWLGQDAMDAAFVARLTDEPTQPNKGYQELFYMKMRSRMNPHRNLNAYLIKSSVSEESLTSAFDANREAVTELIKSKAIPF